MFKLKRASSFLLAVCLMLGALVYTAPQANAYSARPLPELTGDTAQDVANIALSQVGYKEEGGGSVYGAWWSGVTGWGVDYSKLGWCSMFANWCAHQAGAGMNVSYDRYSAVVSNSYNYLRKNGVALPGTFSVTPQPGDFLYFGYSGSFNHVAIVVAYDSATNKVTFVGGNQGDAVTKFTMLYTKSAKYGSQTISGIARPNYGGGAQEVTCDCDESFAGDYICNTVSDGLNIRGGHGTDYPILGTIPKGAKVRVTKAQGSSNSSWAHVEYNGIRGYASIQYLKREQAPEPTDGFYEGYAGAYLCITLSDALNIRSGYSTGSSVVGNIPSGATVYVSKAQGSSSTSWAQVEYNGIKGYASMQYLKRKADYNMTVTYDARTGWVEKADVTVFNHAPGKEIDLVLREQMPVTANSAKAPVITVSAKDGFRVNLEIPMDSNFDGVVPMLLKEDGTKQALTTFELTEDGLLLTVTGSARIQLLNLGKQNVRSLQYGNFVG